jgi:hypothetical protein
VYNNIDFTQPNYSPVDWATFNPQWDYTARNSGNPSCDPCAAVRPTAAVIPSFVCPSCPRSQNPFLENSSDMLPVGTAFALPPQVFRLRGASDYTAIEGPAGGFWYLYLTLTNHPHAACLIQRCGFSECPPTNMGGICASGVLSSRPTIAKTIDQIVDGTSTTFLCFEHAGHPDLWINGRKMPLTHPPLINHNITVSNPGGCWACFENGRNWVQGSTYDGLSDTPVSGPAFPTCFFNCTNEHFVNAIYSFHTGAGGVALCDGSARMLSQNISPIVFVNMISIAGHERVSDMNF